MEESKEERSESRRLGDQKRKSAGGCRSRGLLSVPPVFRMATGVGQGDDQDLVAIEPINDSVGKALQQLAAVASADRFPKTRERQRSYRRIL